MVIRYDVFDQSRGNCDLGNDITPCRSAYLYNFSVTYYMQFGIYEMEIYGD